MKYGRYFFDIDEVQSDASTSRIHPPRQQFATLDNGESPCPKRAASILCLVFPVPNEPWRCLMKVSTFNTTKLAPAGMQNRMFQCISTDTFSLPPPKTRFQLSCCRDTHDREYSTHTGRHYLGLGSSHHCLGQQQRKLQLFQIFRWSPSVLIAEPARGIIRLGKSELMS